MYHGNRVTAVESRTILDESQSNFMSSESEKIEEEKLNFNKSTCNLELIFYSATSNYVVTVLLHVFESCHLLFEKWSQRFDRKEVGTLAYRLCSSDE